MLIIDGDYPMAGGAIRSQRDLTLPIEQPRAAPPDFAASAGRPDSGIMAKSASPENQITSGN